MKNLLLIGLALLTVTASAADITCATYGSGSYPVSKDAIKLAQTLKVTKCDGKRFTTALTLLKQKKTLVPATSTMIESIEKAKELKRSKRVMKKLKDFSF